MKVVLKERDESAAKVVLKERVESSANDVLKERYTSLAASLFADSNDHQTDTKPEEWTSKYVSSYAQGCGDIDNQSGSQTLVCRLCTAKNDAMMNYCHVCAPYFGSTRDAKEGFKRLTAEVSRRRGFNWNFTIRGFVSKAE